MSRSTAPPEQSSRLDAPVSLRFTLIVALFVTCLLVSNIIAVKLIEVHGFIVTAAVLIFPMSYLIGDVLTEVYGFARARQVVWIGFFCNLIAVLAIALGGIMPAASFWGDQAAYDAILGAAPRILLASFVAYLLGELVNAYVLARMKVATGGRHLWMRTIGSTVVGQGIDSTIFVMIAFAGILPPAALVTAIVTQWIAKTMVEVVATPLTYAVVGHLKRVEGLDTYDRGLRFGLFPGLRSRA